MNNKNTGIIATVASVLLCGCPGFFLCIFGAASAFGTGTYNVGSSGGGISPVVGVALVCVSLILLLIPVGVGFFTLRKKPEDMPTTPPPSAPDAPTGDLS